MLIHVDCNSTSHTFTIRTVCTYVYYCNQLLMGTQVHGRLVRTNYSVKKTVALKYRELDRVPEGRGFCNTTLR